MPLVRFAAVAAVPALVIGAFAAPHAAAQSVNFRLIARAGEAFPGRPGYVYDAGGGSPFVGARSNAPNGDIYFRGKARLSASEAVDDILVYRRATGTVEPYVKSGELVDGVPAQIIWGAVGNALPGVVAHISVLKDPALGDRQSVVVAHPDGSRTVAARSLDQAPGYGQPATLTSVGLASGSFLDVNLNSTGMVSYGARFRDQNNVQRYGYYMTRPGLPAERIIDSTMPVPGRPTAQWVVSDQIAAPFDIYVPGLDAEGNAFFRAKYRDGGKDYRVFYRRAVDGSISVIADGQIPDSVPGMPGHFFGRFRAAANNQQGEAAFAVEINKPDGTLLGTGVYLSQPGQSLKKILTVGDSVPGIPEAQNHSPGLIAMGNPGHLLLTDTYLVNGLSGQSLILYNPDGTAEPVLKFNETPGFPGARASQTLAADLNSLGDAVFITRMSSSADALAAFAYLNDTNTLVPVLRTGDTIDGRTVVSFALGGGSTEPLGSVGASSGPVAFDDARNLSLTVVLRDAAGVQSESFYAVQVPSPGASVMLLGVFAARRRRGSAA